MYKSIFGLNMPITI